MKSKLIITGICITLIGGAYAFANEGHDHSADKGSMMEDQGMMHNEGNEGESKAVEVGNKICPVSGDKILATGEKGAMGETVKYEYNGKIYNLCCEMCVNDFKKDPEKYSKIAEEEVKKSQEQGENAEHKEGDRHEHHNHGK